MATRDYKHSGRKKKQQRTLPGWVWMLSGLGIGLFVALLVYLKDTPAPKTVTAAPSISVTKGTQDTREVRKPDAEEIPAPPRPRFDFYTLLPELEVVVPEEEVSGQTATPREAKPKVITQGGEFILQAGSFQKFEEADRLKASLALLGVQAHIQKVEVNDDTWHRVRIGPIASLAEINDIRSRLKANQIDTMLLKAR
ncbi:MAG TPA: SPOR domain-containing protein [Thioalkalivibrio sp.]|nr:SPOR domain-containing protein [Thioalkalivibrio sp.]